MGIGAREVLVSLRGMELKGKARYPKSLCGSVLFLCGILVALEIILELNNVRFQISPFKTLL